MANHWPADQSAILMENMFDQFLLITNSGALNIFDWF